MNIGIIGMGARSRAYTNNIKNYYKEHKIISICDIDKERLDNYVEYFFADEKPDVYTDYRELLNDSRLDAVVITTPDFAHREIVLDAMDKNLHIILEKPIEASTQRAIDIYKRAKNYDKVLMLGFVLRYTSIVERMKAIIDSGEVGEIVSITASENLAPTHSSSYMRRWHRYKKYSGGMMNTKCCHDIDVIRFLVGSGVKKVSAIGRLGIYTHRDGVAEHCKNCPEKDTCLYSFNYDGYKSKTRFDCEEDICVYNSEKDVIDSESMLIEFDNGVNLAYELSMASAEETRKGTINCTKATIEYHVTDRTIKITPRGEGEITTIKLPEAISGHSGGDTGLLDRFFDSCKNGRYVNDAYDGLVATLTCMAGEKSISEGRTISFDEFDI